jgi:hypothetical protein
VHRGFLKMRGRELFACRGRTYLRLGGKEIARSNDAPQLPAEATRAEALRLCTAFEPGSTLKWRLKELGFSFSKMRAAAVEQKLMRHSDIRTTMNLYGDVVTDEMAQAHSKVVSLALAQRKPD